MDIKYGKDGVQSLEVPDERFAGLIHPNEVMSRGAEIEIKDALRSPLGSEPIEDFLKGCEDVVFIVNDGTRPTPTMKVLEVMSASLDLTRFRYLIATGAHRAPTDEEYRFIFGDLYDQLRENIFVHDSREDEMILLGTSKNGTDMWINRMAVEADRLVIITSVEPHYFAGYTGGRKSFLPGVAAFKTIEQNHKLAMRPEAQALVLDGNPVHEDMIDALDVIKGKRMFSIQTVLDRHQEIYRAAAGELHQAFYQAVEWADQVFSVAVPSKEDVVVTVAPYPMDVDLYQSQKALDNGKWALNEGGTIIMVSKCREGVGHATFLDQLSSSEDPIKVMENLDQEYQLGYHKAAKIAEIATWADIWAVTGLEPGLLRKANIKPYRNVQMALDDALAGHPDGRVLFLMDGSITIPRID